VADLLEKIGQIAAAEEALRTYAARARGPQGTLPLARFLARQKRPSEALDLCEKAWKTAPSPEVVDTMLLILVVTRNDPQQAGRAERLLGTALAKEPTAADKLFRLAHLRIFEGRYDEAETLLRQSIDLGPGNTGPMNNLAWLLALRRREGDQALELVNRAIALVGPTPSLLDTRALVYLTLGKEDKAIQDLQESLASQRSASVYFHLAQAYAQTNNRPQAADAYQNAVALGFQPDLLDPLELPAYKKLIREVAQN
jgi:predicted Zn-dependent protease